MGIGYLTEDRRKWGLFLIRSVRENITITFLHKLLNRIGLIKINQEQKVVNAYIEKLNIKVSTLEQAVSELSGGNQQKVITAKLLGSGLDVFLLR